MRLALSLHPASICKAVSGLTVEVTRPGEGGLAFDYELTGRIRDLSLPEPAAPRRMDGLWRHSCFEAFIRRAGGEAYDELNFAPSRHWAAYAFTGYRSGMHSTDAFGAPRIERRDRDGAVTLHARLPVLPGPGPWRLGLSAVIEETDGTISYWALAHPPGKPDFHHPDCFAAELPGA